MRLAAQAAQSGRNGQRPQAGRREVQIVAPKSIRAWAKSPARVLGVRLAASALQRRGQGKYPRHHALDIAVDRRRMCAEGDRRDGRRGIVADAGQRAQKRLGLGEATAEAPYHLPRAGVQIPGAGVIAKPRPRAQHLAELGIGERRHARPAV